MKILTRLGKTADRYLSFEPWHGGFNNVRMSLEIAYALAYMSGRTLVLPPAHQITYHTRAMHLTDFFDINGIPTCEFATFRGMWPKLKLRRKNKRVAFVPISNEVARQWDGIEEVAVIPQVDPLHTVYCFPKIPKQSSYFGKFLVGRTPVKCLGVPARSKVVHFPQTLLGQFYCMIYCPEPAPLRRAVREGVKYHDWVVQAAESIIEELGEYSALHVRRQDFIHFCPELVVGGEQILANIENIMDPGQRVYVATDDPNSPEFEPLAKRYQLCFANDYLNLLPIKARSAEFLPLVEQLICAHGRVFIGSRLSTLSSYIYRLRGYLGMPDTNYYVISQMNTPEPQVTDTPSWHGLIGSGDHWTRDFPEAWQ